MNLNEIIVASLTRLHRGTGTQTIETYRNAFINSANRAMKIMAQRFRQCRKETVTLTDSVLDTADLERQCIRIVDVRVDDESIDFYQDYPGSSEFVCDTNETSVDVIYEYYPKPLADLIDIPELPEHMHDIIPYYVVACERCGGDPETQGTSSADFQLFHSQLAELERSTRGDPRSYKLLNY